MTGAACPSCGTPLEPGAIFCTACGARQGNGQAATQVPPGQVPPGQVPPAQVPPSTVPGPLPMPLGAPMPPMMVRPPRNTRQTASYAAGVMVLLAGVFGLLFGNIILFFDTWETDWDAVTGQGVTVVNAGALFAGVAYLAGFAVSVVSAYCAFRLTRYQLAVAGPVALLVAYFSTLAYESMLLVFGAEVLGLSVIALGLLYFAIPIYEGRGTVPSITPFEGGEEPVDGGPGTGLTSDKYP